MFHKDSDYYFVAYNSILILDILNCYEGESTFYDYRKLIYILPFIANDNLTRLSTKNKKGNERELKLLEDIYINGKLRESILKSILFTLEKKGYLKLEKDNKRKCITVQLIKNTLSREYLDSELFQLERENIMRFKRYYQRLSFIGLESLIEKLFKEKGVIIWDV